MEGVWLLVYVLTRLVCGRVRLGVERSDRSRDCSGLHGAAWFCIELHGSALGCSGLHGAAAGCMVLHGAAWRCIVPDGMFTCWYMALNPLPSPSSTSHSPLSSLLFLFLSPFPSSSGTGGEVW